MTRVEIIHKEVDENSVIITFTKDSKIYTSTYCLLTKTEIVTNWYDKNFIEENIKIQSVSSPQFLS